MQVLSTRDLLDLWDTGRGRDHTTRALLMLEAAQTEPADTPWMDHSIGERDRILIELRRGLFGSRVEAIDRCPTCGTQLEITFDLGDMLTGVDRQRGDSVTLEVGDYHLVLRAPTSRDLIRAIALPNPEDAYQYLLECCVADVRGSGEVDETIAMTEEVRSAVTRAIAEFDPVADVVLDLQCAECAERWQRTFDIVEFLWEEITHLSQRIVRDIHMLAMTYGWSEAEILSLSAHRRKRYLEMVTNG